MTPNALVSAMIRYEMDRTSPLDGRRVVRTDRMMLQTAIQSGDPERIRAMASEARTTLALWA